MITSLKKMYSGKVRDLYEIDREHMLMVASDRLSAFDVILDDVVPQKGVMLTQISLFWFKFLADVMPNHLSDVRLDEVLSKSEAACVSGRALVVKKLTPVPIEAVVRGYLAGSGWAQYQAYGEVCGIRLPAKWREAEQLTVPIFTPSSKAKVGEHDENISFETCVATIGETLAHEIRNKSLELYTKAAAFAKSRGIIIADTKFEFGLDENQRLVLMDEVLTPDSSRFWPLSDYVVGSSPPSYDKQFVRDYLVNSGWDKTPPAPKVPAVVLEKTAQKYHEVLEILTHVATF